MRLHFESTLTLAILRVAASSNSWVVLDHLGQEHVRFGALALLFRRSVLFWPIGRLMSAAMMAKPGDRFYEMIAVNRGRLGRITATWLPFRPQGARPNWVAEASIAALIVVVALVNVGTLPGHKDSVPAIVRTVRDSLSLGQVWNMFAPHPMEVEGWYVAQGIGTDGTTVDVLRRMRGEPSWDRPVDLTTEYANYRWRKYLTRIWKPRYSQHQARYAHYLCDRWNRDRPFGVKLQSLRLYFLKEPVIFTKEERPVEKIFLVENSCLNPPAHSPAGDQRDVDAF